MVMIREQHERSSADFESQRQLLLLALAELALSRPGFEYAIREIVRDYDEEGLPMFEGFKKTNSDRVRETHGPMVPVGPQIGGELVKLLEATRHCLKSYEYGNAATEPAKDMAERIEKLLKDAGIEVKF